MRSTFVLLSIVFLSSDVDAQVIVGGRSPQLPDALGPNGGLKVECIAGTCTGGGGAATTVIANQGALDVTMQPWEFKLSVIDPSVSLQVNGLLTVNLQDSGGNFITSTDTTPFGSEWGLITRNIPFGTQTISGSISNTGFNVNNFPTTATTSAVSVRCVNAAGNAFESCAGGGGAGSDVNIVSIGGNAVTTTIPVSGTVGVSGTVPVSGTFWQATQPVSGTFWQPTQPVSGTVSINAIPTGTNNIGDVDVLTLPSLPTGSNAIGSITNTAFGISGAIPAGTNNIGDVDVLTLPAIPAGNNNIGDVDVLTLPANASVNLNQVAGVAISVGPGVAATNTQRVVLSQESTYAAGTITKTATAAGTGPFFALCGSATKTVRLQRIAISGTVATAAVWGDVIIKKTGTAQVTGGTATTLTAAPYDTNSPAVTATARFFTVLATTPGTLINVILSVTQLFPVTAISATLQPTPAPIIYIWRDQDAEAPTLRGTTECITANFGTTTTNAPTLSVSVAWTEK